MKFLKTLLLTVPVFCLLLTCAGGPEAYRTLDANVYSGSFEQSLVTLNNKKTRKKIYSNKNDILFYLDRGMIKHYAGMYEDSSRDLQEAERLIEEAFTKSISQEIGSYLLNDRTKDYSGEDYEDLYINVFNSLNYYHRDDLEGALVEIRRLNEKLLHLADKYERAIKKVLESDDKIDPRNLPMEASRFSNSALARYMWVLFYRGTGRPDSARIDYEELLRAYGLAEEIYTNPIPSTVHEELSIPSGAGRLNVIAFTGLSPIKEEQVIYIPLPLAFPNNTTKIALPVIVRRPNAIQWAEVVLNTGEKFRLELLEDMGAVAQETFKYKYGLTVVKTTARSIAKAVSGAGIAHAVDEQAKGYGSLVALFGRVFTEVSEQADTRLSRYFPCYTLVGGINLEPGTYTATVHFYGNNSLVYSEAKEIRVTRNNLNLLEFVCLK